MRQALLVFALIAVFSVAGCKELGMFETLGQHQVDSEMESFVRQAVAKSGAELKELDDDDPSVFAWDDVPLDQLPDHERAAKEYQRAKWFSAHLIVDGGEWHVSYRRFNDAWMLDNVSTALINPKTEILYASQGDGHFSNVEAHPVFKHFIPPQHDKAKRAHDVIRRRMFSR